MNTRLQVEHPITELVTGHRPRAVADPIAPGESSDLRSGATLTPAGHAIECRIYAEDPDRDFLPSPGPITALRAPGGPGMRDDGGVYAGVEVPVFYDPLIAKLVAWGDDRPQAIARMARALDEYDVRGIKTTIPFFRWLLADPDFQAGRFDTTFIDARARRARTGGRSSRCRRTPSTSPPWRRRCRPSRGRPPRRGRRRPRPRAAGSARRGLDGAALATAGDHDGACRSK